jgi:hypothetical protein
MLVEQETIDVQLKYLKMVFWYRIVRNVYVVSAKSSAKCHRLNTRANRRTETLCKSRPNRTRVKCDGFEVRESSNIFGTGPLIRTFSLLFLAQRLVVGLVFLLPNVAHEARVPVDTKQLLLDFSPAQTYHRPDQPRCVQIGTRMCIARGVIHQLIAVKT